MKATTSYGKLLEFIKKWEGKRVDYDGVYKYQCVDLIKQFTKEVYDIELGSFGGSAINAWNNNTFDSKWRSIISDYQVWDIIFFNKTKENPYGHVAIITDWGLVNKILEQNGGTGNGDGQGTNAIRIRQVNKKDKILGAYRLKIT